MKNTSRYALEKYTGMKSRHRCPNCRDKHSFTYYIDMVTGDYVGNNVGLCNHLSSCCYHYPPRQYFQDNGKTDWYEKQVAAYVPPAPLPVSFFAKKHLTATQTGYDRNNLVQFLIGIFGEQDVMKVVESYRVGTSDYWNGATVFWSIDKRNRVCSGKVMEYNKSTGKRIKRNGMARINSMRKILQKQDEIEADFQQKKGFFGEHLLRGNDKPVNIVESEKSAIIASIEYPDYVWIACGSRSNITYDRMKLVKGRNVTLYPDNDGYDFWFKKAECYRCKISDAVKKYCSGLNDDIADLLLGQYQA